MKSAQTWRLGMKDMQMVPASRQRGHIKKPTWIIILVSLVSVFLVLAYVYPPQNSAACYVLSSNGCEAISNWLPPAPARELTDDEIASRVVIRDILKTAPMITNNSKIAFLFLIPGALPFEMLWDKFFQLCWTLRSPLLAFIYQLSSIPRGVIMCLCPKFPVTANDFWKI